MKWLTEDAPAAPVRHEDAAERIRAHRERIEALRAAQSAEPGS